MSNIKLPIAELKPALLGLGKIIGRTTLPVLKMVKVERTKDGWVTLTTTDLDHTITVRLEEPTQGEPIIILVGHEDISRIAKKCQKNETIVLSKASGDKILIQFPIGNQTGEEHLESLPVGEYPEVPKVKGEPVSITDAVRLSIQEAFECASDDPTRVILNGAYLDVSQQHCHHVISTDGRHLYGANSFNLPLKNSILIPEHKFLGWKEFNNDGEWQLRVNDDPALLEISGRKWRFISRQIEGNYPNWRQVIPDMSKATTTLAFSEDVVDTILALVQRIPCHDTSNNPIGIMVEGKKVTLRGRGANDTKWTDLDVQGVSVKGKPVEIYLNRHFLTKALRFGMSTIHIIDPLSAMRFSNGGGKQIVVMPVRGSDPKQSAPAPLETPAPAETVPEAAEPERSTTMPRTITPRVTSNGNGNGHHHTTGNGTSNGVTKPPLESAFEQIETIKGSYREAIRGLNALTDTLKQIHRDQRTSEKEVQNVRTTLERLQSVRI